MTETRSFKCTIEFSDSKQVEKYSPQMNHVTLNFHVMHPSHKFDVKIVQSKLSNSSKGSKVSEVVKTGKLTVKRSMILVTLPTMTRVTHRHRLGLRIVLLMSTFHSVYRFTMMSNSFYDYWLVRFTIIKGHK